MLSTPEKDRLGGGPDPEETLQIHSRNQDLIPTVREGGVGLWVTQLPKSAFELDVPCERLETEMSLCRLSPPNDDSDNWMQITHKGVIILATDCRPREADVSRSQSCSCDISENSEFTSMNNFHHSLPDLRQVAGPKKSKTQDGPQ